MKTVRNISHNTVAVVGGAGFLGSHLVNHLVEDRHCRVLVLDNLCAGRREWVHPKADFHHADIVLSEEHLRNLFGSFGVQFVFNYAAWPYIPDSFERPGHVFAVNATGAIHVINASQEAGAAGVLQVSSAEIYGEGTAPLVPDVTAGIGANLSQKIAEDAPVLPHSTYGAAKAAVDYYCQSAWRERKTPVIALRQFNCLGERETHPYVVPEIISQLSAQWKSGDRQYGGQQLSVPTVRLGNNSFRDFLYAGDAVRIAVELLEHGQFGEVYNLGSESGVKIYDLAKRIGKVMGFADVRVEEDPARKRPWEIWHLQANTEKLMNILRDSSSLRGPVPLDEALRRTVAWYEGNGRRWPWEVKSE